MSDLRNMFELHEALAAVTAERNALRAKVQRGLALADEVENRMMATAKPAEIRAALAGGSDD